MTIELGMLVPHTPRMCHEEKAPDFQKEIIQGMHKTRSVIEQIRPDAIVIVSCHWLSSFHHFVEATPDHKGVLTAFECPELISDVHYHFPGDTELARELIAAGQSAGLQVVEVNDPTYNWDYGTIVPLRYLIPNEDIPVIDLSVTWAANLEETFKWGRVIGEVFQESEKKVVFISSGALAHNLVRNPQAMPTITEQAMDKQFIEYLNNNELNKAYEMLPQYSKNAGVEAGGRHLAMLLGVLKGQYRSKYYGYGQSSGSGNVVMTFKPVHSPLPSKTLA
ncbi:DODA-type extradiol aromatic ring-opening family dioxygenase [Bacillus massiliglaciei]|uniref:DODA-type extradiol aromatic ring-opening family dioxygenase n=1 Tax=Bacillus massiliglaciei TaxID=1816693 RepID=UPI000DA5F0EA|nr:extradiol ring-cleavage dioxygenase [Bacillus massiliglaciei]